MEVSAQELKNKKTKDIIYFVKNGDTLYSVAEKFCVKVEDLAIDNDFAIDEKLEEGDILWIRQRNLAIHTVKPLETIASIANKYNVSEQHIKELNDIKSLFIGQRLIIW